MAILHIVGGISFNTLLYIAFIRSMPTELEESARLDGATTWQVFWKIIFPLLAPMNATVGHLRLPRLMERLPAAADDDRRSRPADPSRRADALPGKFNTNYSLAFASYLMAMAPILVAYIFSQRWVMSGVMRGAVK